MTASLGLEAALEEIAKSPKGPTVGAFFDFDGTLIAGYSAMHLSQERLRTRDFSFTEVARTLALGVQAARGQAGFEDVLGVGAAAWKGRSDADLRAMGDRVFERRVSDLVYPEARDLVRAHRARGHTVVLSSSATEYQVEPMARYLEVDDVLCNRYEKDGGVLTGTLHRPVIWGPTKASSVEGLARDRKIDLAKSWFYADGDEDEALMRVVGRPRPTNPSKGLSRAAQEAGWPTLRFTSRSSRPAILKQVASAGALAAAAAGGGLVALARRDRQAGADFVTRHWLSAVFAINDVQLNVVGAEHLRAPRPAVYLYNHRNNVDGFVAASLVGHDFVAVGDPDVARHALVAPLAKLSGVTFLDQDDDARRQSAVSNLVTAASNGRSVLLSPEGGRVDTTTVGPFEDDAFRIALEAGVPIVPIVIANADRIAGRTASTMVSGVVDVAVLPPIDTCQWSEATIGDLVSTTRDAFVDTLAHWPSRS